MSICYCWLEAAAEICWGMVMGGSGCLGGADCGWPVIVVWGCWLGFFLASPDWLIEASLFESISGTKFGSICFIRSSPNIKAFSFLTFYFFEFTFSLSENMVWSNIESIDGLISSSYFWSSWFFLWEELCWDFGCDLVKSGKPSFLSSCASWRSTDCSARAIGG